MDELLGEIGLKPQWPITTGQTLTPYPNSEELKQYPHSAIHLQRAANLALLINLKTNSNKKVPSYAQREAQLVAMIKQDVPEWIDAIDDKKASQSRRT